MMQFLSLAVIKMPMMTNLLKLQHFHVSVGLWFCQKWVQKIAVILSNHLISAGEAVVVPQSFDIFFSWQNDLHHCDRLVQGCADSADTTAL